jgi:uncharacterized membrane protein YjgN (DUF898 family)
VSTEPGRGGPPSGRRGRGNRRQENLDILVGALGFFTVVAFVVTVLAELRGKPALGPALLLLVLVTALWLAIRARRRS